MKLFIALTITLGVFAANIQDQLSKEELTRVDAGGQVVKTKDIKGKKWPEVSLYQIIDASPLESVAVFYAVEHQKNYIPNLIESKVVAQNDPKQTSVLYIMNMPWPLSDSQYTHDHELSKTNETYKVRWWMVKSDSAKSVDGYAVFTPYKGKTLMKYYALVNPRSFLANLVEGKMISDVQLSMEETRKEVLKLKKENKLIKTFISYVNLSLDGQFTYIKRKKDQNK